MTLLERTAATGLYDLREVSGIRCELAAYQAALDLLEPRLRGMERSLFPERMDREQLLKTCRLYGLEPPGGLSDAELSAGVEALRRGAGGWTAASLEAWLQTFGAPLTVREGGGKDVVVSGPLPKGFCANAHTVEALLRPLLPVGVSLSVSLGGMDWDALDRLDLSGNTLDSLDFTWETFDREGPAAAT